MKKSARKGGDEEREGHQKKSFVASSLSVFSRRKAKNRGESSSNDNGANSHDGNDRGNDDDAQRQSSVLPTDATLVSSTSTSERPSVVPGAVAIRGTGFQEDEQSASGGDDHASDIASSPNQQREELVSAYVVNASSVALVQDDSSFSNGSTRLFHIDKKSGCCLKHPDVQVKRKKRKGPLRRTSWESLKPFCERCQAEWDLDMEERRRRIEKETNSNNNAHDAKDEVAYQAVCKGRENGDSVAIVAAMHQCQWSPRVQTKACKALKELATKKKRNPTITASVGGVDAVVAAMRAYPTDEELLIQAAAALQALAKRDQNKVAIVTSGGVGALLAAMRTHMQSSRLQRHCCGALGNLARNEQNQVTIVSSGGVGAIVSAMRTHLDEPRVLEEACGALENFARNEENKTSIAEAGGTALVLSAMREHPDHRWLQFRACGALSLLARKSDENKIAIISTGGIKLITEAMTNHPEVVSLQVQGCDALITLSSAINDRYDKATASYGTMDVVIASMATFPKKHKVQERACVALGSLCWTDHMKAAVRDAGGIEAITKAMNNHPNNLKVQCEACHTLLRLAYDDKNKIAIASAGGIDAVESAMSAHDKAELRDRACRLLRALSLEPINLSRLVELRPALEAARDKVSDDTRKQLDATLKRLSQYSETKSNEASSK